MARHVHDASGARARASWDLSKLGKRFGQRPRPCLFLKPPFPTARNFGGGVRPGGTPWPFPCRGQCGIVEGLSRVNPPMAEPVPFPQPEAPSQHELLSGDTMLKTFAYAKQHALVSLTCDLEEAYTGEDRRKHKIAAASIPMRRNRPAVRASQDAWLQQAASSPPRACRTPSRQCSASARNMASLALRARSS
jgi:hypothetical protein